jgi:exopolysaccharide production protein ExoZ
MMFAREGGPGATFAVRRQAAPSGRIDPIQLLRAIAVLMVVVYHLSVLFPDPLAARWAVPAPLYFGYAGVDLFFVVSGFIITHVTRRDPFDLRAFALKRAFRILPLYWLVTTLIVGIWLVRPGLIDVRAASAWRYLLDSYLLVPTGERPLLGVGWTLQHEFQFYALMAVLLAFGARRAAVPVLLALFGIGVVLRVVVDPGLDLWDWKVFSLYAVQFALGIVLYRIHARWRIGYPALLVVGGVALFVATSSLATPLMNAAREVTVIPAGSFGLIRTLGYGAASFVLALGVLNLPQAQDLTGSGSGRAMLAIGDASFSIYLFHNLVLQALSLGTRRLPDEAWLGFLLLPGGVVAVIASGVFVHRIIERPLLHTLETRVLPKLLGRLADPLTMAARH